MKPTRDGGQRSGPETPRTVQVPLYALVGAGLVGLVSLLLIAFFVGRESARPDVPVTRSAAAPPSPSEARRQVDDGLDADSADSRPVDDAAPEDFESLFPPELNTEPVPDASAGGLLPAGSQQRGQLPPGQGSSAAGSGGDQAVAMYFRDLDSVEREAKYWSNPQDLAMTLLGQVTSGDTSGFDQLVVSQRRARDQVRGISPPASCADHHRRVLSLMDRGVSLLETVRDASVAGDAGGLMALPTQAQQLETEARQVDALGEQIRRRHGVP